jgi:hypothetical protein
LNASGEIDLSNAYDNIIGEWDKVAITWGYNDFPPGTNESTELTRILSAAGKRGLQFISDRDARAPGGLHPQAHLWDNGNDAVTELKDVMKIRAKALNDFGENDIHAGMPMAMLEDVLVPVYFYHRYQIEAATKIVGGMFYNYSLRGDGQMITRSLSKDEQLKALNSIIDCIEPTFLRLPDRIVQMIPPLPAGYSSSKELFRKRTGLAFDALAPAETGADLPLSFLFNSERLNRMAQYEVMSKGLGVAEMINLLVAKTWKAPRLTGMNGLIQMQTEQVLLTYLLAASVNDNNSFVVKSNLLSALKDLKAFAETRLKTTTDHGYKGHLLLAIERMKEPEKAKPTIHKEIPPGAPIGCDLDD